MMVGKVRTVIWALVLRAGASRAWRKHRSRDGRGRVERARARRSAVRRRPVNRADEGSACGLLRRGELVTRVDGAHQGADPARGVNPIPPPASSTTNGTAVMIASPPEPLASRNRLPRTASMIS